MDHVDVQSQFAFLLDQIQLQAAALNKFRGHQQARTAKRDGDIAELAADIAQGIPPHLQLTPAEASDRKRIPAAYSKVQLPKVPRDDNGLAAQAIGSDSPAVKKFALN